LPDLTSTHLSARACAALNNGDVDAGGGETDGTGEAGESGAHNNDALRCGHAR
jgi:hypothetical protein